MSESRCLKTGCQLELGGLFYWGDLHTLPGDTLVFNAVLDTRGEACAMQQQSTDVCSLRPIGAVFERRGVFVFEDAEPNAALTDHLSHA